MSGEIKILIPTAQLIDLCTTCTLKWNRLQKSTDTFFTTGLQDRNEKNKNILVPATLFTIYSSNELRQSDFPFMVSCYPPLISCTSIEGISVLISLTLGAATRPGINSLLTLFS